MESVRPSRFSKSSHLFQGLGAAQGDRALLQNVSGLELSSSSMFILTPSVHRMGQQELSSLSQPPSTRSGAIDEGEGIRPAWSSHRFTEVSVLLVKQVTLPEPAASWL